MRFILPARPMRERQAWPPNSPGFGSPVQPPATKLAHASSKPRGERTTPFSSCHPYRSPGIIQRCQFVAGERASGSRLRPSYPA